MKICVTSPWTFMSIMQAATPVVCLLLLALVAPSPSLAETGPANSSSLPIAGKCNGDGGDDRYCSGSVHGYRSSTKYWSTLKNAPGQTNDNSTAGYICPATDPVASLFRDGYNPAAVDWNAVVADIVAIGTQEPRFCNFAIRSWFHDFSGFKSDFDGALDGSFITDAREQLEPEGSLHGFGRFTRHVILQIAAAHGASHADVLTVAAAKCTTEVLGGTVDITSHCEAAAIPLNVGKMDFADNYDNEMTYRHKVNGVPTTHSNLSGLLDFFMKNINGRMADAGMRVNAKEVMALMGAHAIMMTHACTTNGEAPAGGTAPDMGDRTCGGAGGRQRMFTWDNSFFKDMAAGTCFQTNVLTDDGDFTVKMTPDEHEAFTQCGFTSMEGFELAEQLECSAMKESLDMTIKRDGQKRIDGLERKGAFNEGWQTVGWERSTGKGPNSRFPIETSAPCCGFQCSSCEDDPENKFWCKGPMLEKQTKRMWPYTYIDCNFNRIINMEGGEGFCAGEYVPPGGERRGCESCRLQCERWHDHFGNPLQEMEDHIQIMHDAILEFRENRAAWEETYATAFCKLTSFGASFVPNKVSLQQQLKEPSQGCLTTSSVLSMKECKTCELSKFGTLRDPGPLSGSTNATTPPLNTTATTSTTAANAPQDANAPENSTSRFGEDDESEQESADDLEDVYDEGVVSDDDNNVEGGSEEASAPVDTPKEDSGKGAADSEAERPSNLQAQQGPNLKVQQNPPADSHSPPSGGAGFNGGSLAKWLAFWNQHNE